MRIVLHDFSGHPFQAELSRKLAARGHTVEHVFSEQYVSGKGHLERQSDDADGLTFTGITIPTPFKKYAPLSRLRFERAYAKHWIAQLERQQVDQVVACNIPLFALARFARYAKRRGLPWVFWHQDIYSFALGDELRRRLPRPIAGPGARMLEGLEARCARQAAHMVAIGPAFSEVYDDWGIPPAHTSVIPNWAPLRDVYPVERDNARSSDLFGADAQLRLLYAGTLGRKHNPLLLVDLLRTVRARGIEAALTVVSEGEPADELAEIARREPGLGMRVLPFQPADDLPDVLGSADVLVALLEPDATKFSIPSKVLSYMAAGRPILGLMPADNPAATDIRASGGFVTEPDAEAAERSTSWLVELVKDPDAVADIGRRTRKVAEQKFEAESITDSFETVLTTATVKG
jgi:glycosyltransferase involved in cell wall biosynthesis